MLWEVNLAIQAYAKRLERSLEHIAIGAIWTARATWSKRGVSVNELLGKQGQSQEAGEKFTTGKAWREAMKKAKHKKEYDEWIEQEKRRGKSESLAYMKGLKNAP